MTQSEPEEARVTYYFKCPRCHTISDDVDDIRFGYCWTCHDFTGEPTDFVFHGDEEFGRRVKDVVREQWRIEPPIVLSEEERERVWQRNRIALAVHMRQVLAVEPIAAFIDPTLFATPPERDFNPPPEPLWWARFLRRIRVRRR